MREYVQSSNLEWIDYNPNSLVLKIGFKNGSEYEYYYVPNQVYNNLKNASSHGSYFYHNIRGVYKFAKIHN